MIRSLLFQPEQTLKTNLPINHLTLPDKNINMLLWVDFSGENPENCEPILTKFGFHYLTIDDALQETHTPKVDDWGDYLYLVMNHLSLNGNSGGWETETEELDGFLGSNYIITHHDTKLHFLDQVWDACQRDTRHLHEGADHILYRLLDRLVSDYILLLKVLTAISTKLSTRFSTAQRPPRWKRYSG